jgi:hypothetical protein
MNPGISISLGLISGLLVTIVIVGTMPKEKVIAPPEQKVVSVAEVCNTNNEGNLKVYQSAAVTVVAASQGDYTCVLYHPYGERDVDQPMRIEAIYHNGKELRTQFSTDFAKSAEMRVVVEQAKLYSELLMAAETL